MHCTELNMDQTEQELENGWTSINWKEIELFVKKLQGRIFLATENRNYKNFYYHPNEKLWKDGLATVSVQWARA